MASVQIPGLGTVVKDATLGWYRSAPISARVLGDIACRFVVNGYDDDPAQEDFHAAIRTFLALDRSAVEAAAPAIYAYYRDVMDDVLAAGDDDWNIETDGPHDVLDHVRLGDAPMVKRDPPPRPTCLRIGRTPMRLRTRARPTGRVP
jgi:hypothetical protein